jgi:hypothetical protein
VLSLFPAERVVVVVLANKRSDLVVPRGVWRVR